MLCRIYQLAIENELDSTGSVRRPLLARHLEKCSDCRTFYHRLKRVESQLRSAPTCHVPDEQVHRLQRLIQQRLNETASGSGGFVVRKPFRLHPGYAVSAAAAVVVISLLGLYYVRSFKPIQTVDPASHFVSNVAVLQTRMSLLARLPEQSMHTEMQKLANNARSVAGFLGNCIPAAPADIDTAENTNTPK